MYSICRIIAFMINTEVFIMFLPELDPYIVGKVILQFRMTKGKSQEIISGLAGIGRTHLSAIERGERKPTLETLYRLSLAMDIKMSTIVIEIEKEIERSEKKV